MQLIISSIMQGYIQGIDVQVNSTLTPGLITVRFNGQNSMNNSALSRPYERALSGLHVDMPDGYCLGMQCT